MPENADLFFLILIIFFGILIALQIIIAKRLNAISSSLFEILIELNKLIRKPKQKRKIADNRNCAICKYRVPFFDLKKGNNQLVYYRCRLTDRKVAPDFICENFAFDSKQKDAGK